MPRKKSGENLTKVVSTIIPKGDFEILEKYTKLNYYNQNLLQNDRLLHKCYAICWAIEQKKSER